MPRSLPDPTPPTDPKRIIKLSDYRRSPDLCMLLEPKSRPSKRSLRGLQTLLSYTLGPAVLLLFYVLHTPAWVAVASLLPVLLLQLLLYNSFP